MRSANATRRSWRASSAREGGACAEESAGRREAARARGDLSPARRFRGAGPNLAGRLDPQDHPKDTPRDTLTPGSTKGRRHNAWLADLYNGEQDVVPDEVVKSSVPLPARPVARTTPSRFTSTAPTWCSSGPKEYVVLEDNVRCRAGSPTRSDPRAGLESMGDLYESYASAPSLYYDRAQEVPTDRGSRRRRSSRRGRDPRRGGLCLFECR